MATSQSQRLKRKADKEARRRLVVAQKQKAELAFIQPRNPRDLLATGQVPPIYGCFVSAGLFHVGIGSMLLARKTPSGLLAVSVFLVDVWCLGVKDAFFRALSRSEFDEFLDTADAEQSLVDVDPSVARKLLHGAVDYARGLGLAPCEDYAKAEALFFDTPLAADEFVFGKEGKPYFCTGPKDTPARCRQILKALEDSVGPGGFEYTVGLGSGF